jgi:hypothetical protein
MKRLTKQHLARAIFAHAQDYVTKHTTPAYGTAAVQSLAATAHGYCPLLTVRVRGRHVRVDARVVRASRADFATCLRLVVTQLGADDFGSQLQRQLSARESRELRELGVLA